ncbi:hypothetical protein JCM19233_2875 [Vibrio astriarenae]|nr:hypothetical protein JCM19233_2875 [Vibrio sp. C7]
MADEIAKRNMFDEETEELLGEYHRYRGFETEPTPQENRLSSIVIS